MSHHADDGSSHRSFTRAYEAAFPVLCARLTRLYGDPQLAEEVSVDCLADAYKVWREDPHFFDEKDLTAWSSQRARWRTLDCLRERARFTPLAVEHSGDGESKSDLLARAPDPDETEEARQRRHDRQVTWDSLQSLDSEDREILESYYYDGETDQQIGTRRYGPAGTDQARGLRVWRRRQKALERLRTVLIKNGIDPADYAPQTVQAV